MSAKPFFHVLISNYLRFFARIQLAKNKPEIIGITGSAGKTSTQNAIYAILKHQGGIKVSHKANSETGIPLNILDLSPRTYDISDWLRLVILTPWKVLTAWPSYQRYLVELGVDSPFPPKNMRHLLTIVQPSTAVFLNVQPAHSEAFDPLATATDPLTRRQEIRHLIAEEKGYLIEQLPETGYAILNADDDAVSQFQHRTKASVLMYGQEPTNHVSYTSIKQTLAGTQITFASNIGEKATLKFSGYLLPNHFAPTFAAALCVGITKGLSLQKSIDELAKHFRLPPGRSSLIPGVKGSLILDSSYNASAAPTIESLELLASIKPGRALALLGDMRELGKEAAYEHRLVAQRAAQICHKVYLVGPLTRQYMLPVFQELGITASWHENALLAAAALKHDLKVGDVLLVKGSQNTLFLETAVKKLMRHPSKAKQLLCRQSAFWDRQRKAVGL